MSRPNQTSADTSRSNAEWAEAIVKWTRYEYVAVYDYPTTNNSDAILEMYKGDMIQINRRYRREDWCLCRVGHVLGWVFLDDVRFLVRGSRPPRRKRTQQIPIPNHTDPNETDTAVPMLDRTEIDLDMEIRTAIHEKIASPITPDPNEVDTAPMPTLEQIDNQLEMDTYPVQRQQILKPETGEPESVAAPPVDKGKKSLINRMIRFFQR